MCVTGAPLATSIIQLELPDISYHTYKHIDCGGIRDQLNKPTDAQKQQEQQNDAYQGYQPNYHVTCTISDWYPAHFCLADMCQVIIFCLTSSMNWALVCGIVN